MSTSRSDWFTFDGVSFSSKSFVVVWVLALAAYGVGDVVTTIALVWFDPLYVEGNPVISVAIDAFGGGGFLAIKLLVFYTTLAVSLWGGGTDENPVVFYAPPLILVGLGVLTTAFNLRLLL